MSSLSAEAYCNGFHDGRSSSVVSSSSLGKTCRASGGTKGLFGVLAGGLFGWLLTGISSSRYGLLKEADWFRSFAAVLFVFRLFVLRVFVFVLRFVVGFVVAVWVWV